MSSILHHRYEELIATPSSELNVLVKRQLASASP
jgi:hypothetical protein